MNKNKTALGRIGAWLTALLSAVLPCSATPVDLDALVTFAIYDQSGTVPLADGSIVYIIGSGNNVINDMAPSGPGSTNYIAYSTTGDDVILGTTRIDSSYTGSNGTFQVLGLSYDDAVINYAYIRFFNTSYQPIGGYVYYGESAMFQLPTTVTNGVAQMDFNPSGNLSTEEARNFVVIPEPSTASLLLLVGGIAWAMRVNGRNRKRVGNPSVGGPHEKA